MEGMVDIQLPMYCLSDQTKLMYDTGMQVRFAAVPVQNASIQKYSNLKNSALGYVFKRQQLLLPVILSKPHDCSCCGVQNDIHSTYTHTAKHKDGL